MKLNFSHQSRQKNLDEIPDQDFDLCIIGGGITGAGVARDATSRGMKVCLFEQDDFASGTSSRSSKLIHGGIRYLENLEFGLVFEALNERHILFNIAPHLVHPLTFILPLYKGGRVGMFMMGLGMWLYDVLALLHTPKFHERLSRGDTLEKLVTLRSKGLLGSYLYSDAYMDDDRLVIETLRSAQSFGAKAVNYAKVIGAKYGDGNKICELEIEDLKSNKKIKVRAKHFISTVGPWTDLVGAELVREWKKLLRPSKGIHLVVPAAKIPTKSAVVMATDNDKRIVFAIPRGQVVIVGTTDTDFKDNPETVKSNIEDVTYLLKIVNSYFPGSGLTQEDIISSYAGVRPLVDDGSQSESKTSREHVIKHTPFNITFVAGGKYTTYRRMARDIVQVVLKEEFSPEERVQFARNQTRDVINPLVSVEKLVTAQAQAKVWAQEFSIDLKICEALAARHGFEALDILIMAQKEGLHTIWEMEALFAIRHTSCLHLRDFMLRRTPLYLTHRDHGQPIIEEVVKVFAKWLGWSTEQIENEKEIYQQHIKTEMGWRNKNV